MAVGLLICSLSSSKFREKFRCTSSLMVSGARRTHLADELPLGQTWSNHPLEPQGSGDGDRGMNGVGTISAKLFEKYVLFGIEFNCLMGVTGVTPVRKLPPSEKIARVLLLIIWGCGFSNRSKGSLGDMTWIRT